MHELTSMTRGSVLNTKTKRFVAGAASIAAALILVSVAAVHAQATATTSGTVALTTVSAATLAANGITLQAPQAGTSPAVSESSAAATASNAVYANSSVREQVLASLTDTTVPGMTSRMVWAVSVMPPGGIHSVGGPAGSAQQAQSYMIVFVDATTGAFLYANSGNDVATQPSGTKTRS